MDERIKKKNVIYMYGGLLSSHTKEGNSVIHNNMDELEGRHAK